MYVYIYIYIYLLCIQYSDMCVYIYALYIFVYNTVICVCIYIYVFISSYIYILEFGQKSGTAKANQTVKLKGGSKPWNHIHHEWYCMNGKKRNSLERPSKVSLQQMGLLGRRHQSLQCCLAKTWWCRGWWRMNEAFEDLEKSPKGSSQTHAVNSRMNMLYRIFWAYIKNHIDYVVYLVYYHNFSVRGLRHPKPTRRSLHKISAVIFGPELSWLQLDCRKNVAPQDSQEKKGWCGQFQTWAWVEVEWVPSFWPSLIWVSLDMIYTPKRSQKAIKQ